MTLTLPTQRTKPITELDKQTILLYSAPKLGKCLAGETVLYDPNSSRPKTLSRVVADGSDEVLSMGMAGVIAPAAPSAYIENPTDLLYRVTTQTGRVIEATINIVKKIREIDAFSEANRVVPPTEASKAPSVIRVKRIWGKAPTSPER